MRLLVNQQVLNVAKDDGDEHFMSANIIHKIELEWKLED
jgi:hypothetical protein